MKYEVWMGYLRRLRHIMDDPTQPEETRQKAEHWSFCNEKEIERYLERITEFLTLKEKGGSNGKQ